VNSSNVVFEKYMYLLPELHYKVLDTTIVVSVFLTITQQPKTAQGDVFRG